MRIKAGLVFLTVAFFSLGHGQVRPPSGQTYQTTTFRVLAVGDSITYGYGAPGGYRAILEARLKANGYRYTLLGSETGNSAGLPYPGHEGHGGWSTTDITGGRQNQPEQGKLADWVRAYKPDTVLVMIGTNDGVWMDRADWKAKYEKLLDIVFAYNPKMKVAMACIPKSDNAVTGKSMDEALNFDVVRSVVYARRALGFRIRFADVYTPFNPDVDLFDAYHPNARGYKKIADAFYSAMTRL